MDIMTMGSVRSYVNTLKMETKWAVKKESGDFTAATKRERDKATAKQMLEDFKKSDEDKQKLNSIYAKLEKGSKLTQEEMEYLKAKNPTAYQKAKELEIEKAAYERAIKRCKTKEDVERLKLTKLSEVSAAISSVKNNPNIPKGTKLAIAEAELRKLKAIDKIHLKFAQSGELGKLPSEAEKHKAESDMKRAEEAEREKSPGMLEEAEEAKEAAEGEVKPAATEEAVSEGDRRSVKGEGKTLEHEKLARIKSEQTPEIQKVKRAKMKYPHRSTSANIAIDLNISSIDKSIDKQA